MKVRKEIKDKVCRLLCGHAAFSGVLPDKVAAAADSDNVLLHDVAKGQQIFPCHSSKKAVVLLLSGQAAVKRADRIVSTVSEGEIFGTQTLYSDSGDGMTVSALTDCRTVVFKKAAVDELLGSDFAAAQGYLRYLSHKISDANGNFAASQATSAESKLAQYLLSRQVNAIGEVSLPQDMLKLAKQLGLGKDGLYRAFDKLNSSGAIGFSGSRVTVKNRELLETFRS